jgi:hypothetical protein
MAKRAIPLSKRYALWIAHQRRCSYCREPLAFADLWVDHILPEHLIDDPQKRESVLEEFDLGPDFDLHDYGNWLPAHARCNLQKGKSVFERGAARYFVSIAGSRVDAARAEEHRLATSMSADHLLAKLGIAVEKGVLPAEEVIAALNLHSSEISTGVIPEPLVVSYGLYVPEVLEDPTLPPEAPRDFPGLADWLENDLSSSVESSTSSAFFQPESSQRTGETLSTRIAFLNPDLDEIEEFENPWWRMTDIAPYSSIYGSSSSAAEST